MTYFLELVVNGHDGSDATNIVANLEDSINVVATYEDKPSTMVIGMITILVIVKKEGIGWNP